ncbi:MAG TPA: hypothetical protein VGI81_19720 [Tepidisphaeraceae bacterium]
MPIESFERLLVHSAPAFACHACGDPQEKEAFIAPVSHVAHPPATAAALQRIPRVPGADAARAFFASHDGGAIYTAKGLRSDPGGDDEGIEIFPLHEWGARTKEVLDFWNASEYEDDEMPYGRDDFIAIAHSRGASTYIHWVVRGRHAGSVYWWPTTMPPEKHDGPLAADFGKFIETICTQPVHFLNDLLFCYTRFSDGKTKTQWIPKRYIPDRRSVGIPAEG